jgi:hypothetical protein
MKITFKHLAFVGFILARWQLNAQAVIVYEDLFSNNCEGSTSGILPTCQNGTSPNNNKWGYVDQDAGTGVSWKFTGGEGYLQNQFGVNYIIPPLFRTGIIQI